jgi:hypothetical protein
VLMLWQVCTSKSRKNFLFIFGNHPVLAAYEKISVDSIPQKGKHPAGSPRPAKTTTGSPAF